MAAPPPPPEAGDGEDTKDGVEVCLFDESADGFSRTVRAISNLVDVEPEPDFPETEVERLSSSITFLREWRHFSYEPKSVSFTNGTESTSSRDGTHSVTLPQFSSASVPQITPQEDRMDNTVSFDFILYAGGNVWALDWCPRLYEKPGSSINCEYLAVSAHPPGSSYHKLGMPLTGRGIIQVWCLLAPFEDAHSRSMNLCNNGKRRGRPRKTPCSDQLEPVPKGPRGRPRKRPKSDQLEPVPKRPRGRPRKHPLAVAKFDSSQNSESQDIILFDPLSTSSVIPDDLPLAYVKPTVKSVQSTPKRGRGRPRKNPINKLTGSSGTASEDVCTTPPSTSATCTKPKKPRGRPRKYPVPVSRADVELEKGTCQPVSFGCSLDHTACTEFNANLSIVAVDAALSLIDKLPDSSGTVSKDVCTGSSPTTAICTKPKRPRGRPRKYAVPVSGKSVSGVHAEVGKDTTCQSVSFGCSLDHTACTKFNANLSIVPVDAALPIVDELSGSSGTSLKESVCTEPYPATAIRKQPKRTRVRPRKYSETMIELGKDTTGQPVLYGCSIDQQFQKIPASNESSGTSVGGKSHKMERLSKSVTKGSSKSDGMAHGAGLNQSKNEIVGCEGIKVSESNTAIYDSHCNENARVNQVAPTLKSSDRVIYETEAAELVPHNESREDDNMFSSVENSNSSSITKDMAQPRLVLCLAHNGKVAWDIKWKPPLLSQQGQKSRLGFLAVLLGNGSLEVWEVPSPCMVQKIYSPSKVEGSDPRFLKLQPVFRCVKVKCGNRQSIPLTVDWSPSPPHDMILAGCHDGTVAVWKFSVNLSLQDSKPFMCVTADSVPIRDLSWAPCISEENINTFVTAGEDGVKFWDLRDPYRPLWELTTAPKAVLSLHWLKDGRGIVISLDDGTLKFLSLPRIANDVPATGRPFAGTKTQGVANYQLSEYLIWSVHVSEPAGCVAYCGADGTAVYFQLNSRFWDKEPGRNRVPYFLSGSISEEGENIKIGSRLLTSPLPNVPVVTKKGSKPCQNIVQALTASDVTGLLTCQVNSPTGNGNAINPEHHDDQDDGHSEEQGAGAVNQDLDDDQDDVHSEEQAAGAVHPEFGYDQDDVHSEEQGPGAIVSANPTEEENDGACTSKGGVSPKDLKVIPPKSVALHQVRWNTNKGSERWLCYGGAAGIIRCQRI